MKKYLLASYLIFWFGGYLYAQGENNIWSFSRSFSLDFNTTPPTLKDSVFINGDAVAYPALSTGSYERSIAVCGPAGNLRFMVKLGAAGWNANSNGIWDRYEVPIPGTDLLGFLELSCRPLVIPNPADADQYYIFYVRGKALYYSLFDMSLNGGLGNIVPGKQNVQLSGFGTVIGERMTAIVGCTGVWLVIRSHIANEYYSYLVNRDGLDTTAVVSECGLFPVEYYRGNASLLKASPNGRMLATGFISGGIYSFTGGLELYDFEPCSGKIKNARILETGNWIYGTCFSPDNTKLYTTQIAIDTNNGFDLGRVYQYDLNLPSLADIIGSKTLILTNPPYPVPGPCGLANRWLKDIKLGPDGKVYLLNEHPGVCYGSAMAFHVIHQPNNPGLSCMPQITAIWNVSNGMKDWYSQNDLPHPIIVAPPPPDTLPGNSYPVTACFVDSISLTAQQSKQCYRWDNNGGEINRTVHASGIYFVTYFNECTITTDTYHVQFISLPKVPLLGYGCPGEISFTVDNQQDDTNSYRYTLLSPDGQTLREVTTNSRYSFSGLYAGIHSLQIKTASGCDTTIYIQLEAYPKPDIIVSPIDTTIGYGQGIMLNASGANLYTWWPTSTLDTATKSNPVASPLQPTLFTVMGLNEYGCRDTGYINISIDYTMPDFVPNAFSPNGDGLNDVFSIANVTYQKVAQFQVFNRYGQEVFSTKDGRKGWDGMQNGKSCDAGTYYFLIVLDYPDGRRKTYKGDLQLIR